MSNKNNIDEDLLLDIEFEMNFYEYIAGTSNFEVIPIPDLEGFIPSTEEFQLLVEDCRRRTIKLLYRVSNGKYALVFSADSDKVGMVPEDNSHGFYC